MKGGLGGNGREAAGFQRQGALCSLFFRSFFVLFLLLRFGVLLGAFLGASWA